MLPTPLRATGERREGFDVVVAAEGTSVRLPFPSQLLAGQAESAGLNRREEASGLFLSVQCPPGW